MITKNFATIRRLALLCLIVSGLILLSYAAFGQTGPPKTLVVAVDQSTRMTPTDAAFGHLKRLLYEEIHTPGDRVVLVFLHESTGQIGNQQTFRFAPSDPGNEVSRLQAKAQLQQQVMRAATAVHSATESHLLELFPLLHTLVLPQTKGSVRIVMLTDLIQNSPFVRVCPGKVFVYPDLPSTQAAATQHARTLRQQYGLTAQSFGRVESLRVFLPAQELPAAQPLLLAGYWNQITAELGLPTPQIIGQ